jgi:hypothetical protein
MEIQNEEHSNLRNVMVFSFEKKFYKLNMQENLSISKFLVIVKDILGQIVEVGDAIKDENVILTILNVLLNSYENLMQDVSVQFLIN